MTVFVDQPVVEHHPASANATPQVRATTASCSSRIYVASRNIDAVLYATRKP